MPLFDDPVEATIGGEPVLWLGCETDGDGIYAVVVSASGDVNTVTVTSLRANFRRVNGTWSNVDDAGAKELLARDIAEGLAAPATATEAKPAGYPAGVIFDSDGNPYTSDGDPLPRIP